MSEHARTLDHQDAARRAIHDAIGPLGAPGGFDAFEAAEAISSELIRSAGTILEACLDAKPADLLKRVSETGQEFTELPKAWPLSME